MLTCIHTNTDTQKTLLHPSPSPWHSSSAPGEMSALRAVLASSITSGALTGEEPDLSLQILCLQETCPNYLAGKCSVSVWSEGERGCDQECQRELRDTTIYYWMCCDLDSRKHLGTCTSWSSLVMFSSFLWHLSQTFTGCYSSYTWDPFTGDVLLLST